MLFALAILPLSYAAFVSFLTTAFGQLAIGSDSHRHYHRRSAPGRMLEGRRRRRPQQPSGEHNKEYDGASRTEEECSSPQRAWNIAGQQLKTRTTSTTPVSMRSMITLTGNPATIHSTHGSGRSSATTSNLKPSPSRIASGPSEAACRHSNDRRMAMIPELKIFMRCRVESAFGSTV